MAIISEERAVGRKRKAQVQDYYQEPSRSLVSPIERRSWKVRLGLGTISTVLIIISLTFIIPLIWFVLGSLKTGPELLQMPPALLPTNAQWQDFAKAWVAIDWKLYFWNTLVITVVGWAIPMVVTLMAAYSFSKLRPSYGNVVFFLFLTTMMIPGVVYIIPQFLNIKNLGLLNNWFSLWLPNAFSAFNILLMKSYFDSIPNELSDSAVLDGANPLQIFWHIILPLSYPAIAVLTIFALLGGWQQFFGPFLYITDANLWPIGTALYKLLPPTSQMNIRLACLVIAAIPPLVFFAIFQKQIIKGINLSGFMNG